TDFPTEAFGGASTGNDTLPVLHEGVPLIVGDDQFGKDLALVFRVNDKLRKEILFILVDAAKPIVVGDTFHARNSGDLIAIGKGDGIDEGGAVYDPQAVGSRNIGAAGEGIPHDREKDKEEEGHGKRTKSKEQANL